MRYGSRSNSPSDAPDGAPLFSETRREGFGEEVKRRILLGTYSLSAAAMDNYFIQAQRIRRLVQDDFNRVFRIPHPLLSNLPGAPEDEEAVDVLIHPTAPTLPPMLEGVREQTALETYINDVFTVPASLAGLPAVSVPVPCADTCVRMTRCGMQVVGQFGSDEMVLKVAQLIEDSVAEGDIRPEKVPLI